VRSDRGTLTITTRPITVKANDVSRVYGDSTPAFSLALSSGTFASGDGFADLGGTPSFDTGAPASGHQAVGSYPIVVSGLTSSNYAISYATGSDRGTLTITTRPLTVTVDDKSKTYDGNPFTAFTSSITGFASGENESVISGSVGYGGTATTAINTGNYAISGDVSGLSAANYSFGAATSGNLTSNQRAITVTADPKSKVFGTADPPLTYQLTSGSLVSGDGFSGSLTRDPGELVGSYPIRKGTLTAGPNYNLTYVGANLTITAWNADGKGFYAPVGIANSLFVAAPGALPTPNSSTIWNTVKGCQTVPLKFNVYAGTVEKTSLTDILSFTQASVPCISGDGTDPVDITTTGNTSLR
jgi:MBG domain-containing protein